MVSDDDEVESAAVVSVFAALSEASSAVAPEAEAAVSASVGAGFSGSSSPSFWTSIQRTTCLSEYVWSALKTSWSASVGSMPTETGNFWK